MDTTPAAPDRELEDAGLAGYAASSSSDGADTQAAPEDASAPEPDMRPYSADELAQLTAAFTAFGIPAENLDPYQREVLARTRPGFEMLGIGDALLEYGIGHGAGVGTMPAWARLLAGAAVVGFTVIGTRRQFASPPESDAGYRPEDEAQPEGAA